MAQLAPDPGWRLVMIPSYERPPMHQKIPGSQTAILAVARPTPYGDFEYATTKGAWRFVREQAESMGGTWLTDANVQFRRDQNRVINRILIVGDDPLNSSLALVPALYHRFEPMLGDGFHVVIPDRNTIALYPRIAGRIPPEDVAVLLEIYRMATYPVSREVFQATSQGLVADGILEE